MLAVLCPLGQAKQCQSNINPQAALDSRKSANTAARKPDNPYSFTLQPADVHKQLEFFGKLASHLVNQRSERDTSIRTLVGQVHQQSAWGITLDLALSASNDRVVALQAEVLERNAWAQQMQLVIEKAESKILTLRHELADRTAWAQNLESEWKERTSWALALDQEVSSFKQHEQALLEDIGPFLPATRFLSKLLRRFRLR